MGHQKSYESTTWQICVCRINGGCSLSRPSHSDTCPIDRILGLQTVTALTAYDTSTFGTNVPHSLTAGSYAAAEQSGNWFSWSSSSPIIDSGGTVIKPDAVSSLSSGGSIATGSSRYGESKNLCAKGNGIADDKASINSALAM
jgi:hypothetical protein